MCLFSQPIELVSDTNRFAGGANGRQFLVYGMGYAAAADLGTFVGKGGARPELS